MDEKEQRPKPVKGRQGKKPTKSQEMEMRLSMLEQRVNQLNTSSYDFLIKNVERLSFANQQYVATLNLQQEYLTEMGYKEDYVQWLEDKSKAQDANQKIKGVEDDGKIKRISGTETGKGKSGKPDKPNTGGAKGTNKDSPGTNEEGNKGTQSQPELPEQKDSGNPK